MTARAVPDLPPKRAGGWAFEPKFDGFRCLAFRSSEGVVLQSRQERMLGRFFPEIVAAVADQLHGQVVLDGELVVARGGRFDFAALQGRLHPAAARVRALSATVPACFVAFDLLAVRGRDLCKKPLHTRRERLATLMAHAVEPLVLMPMTTDRAVAERWLTDHSSVGIEGVVAKPLDQPYRPGGRSWQKVRTRRTAEAVVGGVLGSLKAPDALIVGRPDETGRLRIAGRTGHLSPKARRELKPLLRRPKGHHPWPDVIPSSRFGQRPSQPVEYTKVAPTVVVELDVDTAFVEAEAIRTAARDLLSGGHARAIVRRWNAAGLTTAKRRPVASNQREAAVHREQAAAAHPRP